MSVIHLRLFGGAQVSVHENGATRRVALPPKPTAIMAYLAVASADGLAVRRDVLVALFWPELSTPHARAALRQMLFQLRKAVGENALVTDRDSVALDLAVVESDVSAFEQLLAGGDREAALEIYKGPLLAGFFVDGMSAEVETWIESQRSRIARKAVLACGALADAAEQNRNGIDAARWARAAVDLSPDDELAHRRLIEVLAAFGDRAGALRAADEFARRLDREFGSMPSAETQALVASIRRRRAPPDLPDESVAASRGAAVPVEEPAPGRLSQAGSRAAAAPAQPVAPSARLSIVSRASLAASVVLVASVGTFLAGRARANEMRRVSAGDSPNSPPITMSSTGTWRLYAAGMDRYRAGDNREGVRLLNAALGDDSTCAMCAYYAGRANAGVDDAGTRRMLRVAMRLSSRASEPERLLIHFGWADAQNSPIRRAVAESLVTRYPGWAEAQMAAGEAAMMDGEALEAAGHLRLAIDEASAQGSASAPNGIASTAGVMLINDYEIADSMPAALRVARALAAQQRKSRMVWLLLSHMLARSGRFDEARAALDSSTLFASGSDDDLLEHADVEIRAGNFVAADGILRALAQTGDPQKRVDALWILTISLRTQGRVHDALDVAVGPLRAAESTLRGVRGISRVAEAQAYFELGEDARAAELFSREARTQDSLLGPSPASVARQRAWMFTQAGAALAAGGDTAALARLADTVRAWGQRSGLRRDGRLFLFLRGLLWTSRARPDSALSDFRLATVSETDGFSRLNLYRAKALLTLSRPADAIPVLEHSLAGPIDAGNSYVTRTELQYELGRAYDMAGVADSAATYYRAVVHAWSRADPLFRAAVARARSRLEAGEEHASHRIASLQMKRASR
jgi:DNA-binding SARP family transcriptional activator/tetratricopeptide (TPR) repeat protein